MFDDAVPAVIPTFPPVVESAVVSPAAKLMSPPFPVRPDPTENMICPPFPLVALPVEKDILPLVPLLVVPEEKVRLPLTPEVPAFCVENDKEPLDVSTPMPLFNEMAPPVRGPE